MPVRHLIMLPLVALSGFLPWHGYAADDYAAELAARAERLNLAQERQWHLLLHYESDLFGGVTSTADSADFFLAPDGKTNPHAELTATLQAFFIPPTPNAARHPQCRFIARYHWLQEQLAFDPARLPEHACPAFEEWYAAIDPERITLVFPAAYLNNPASMYGHTLLRIDPPAGTGATALTSYALNFAAQTNDTNGLVFAVKGLTGLYAGRFAVLPYYDKVNTYGDIENRDIWEYALDFSPVEVRMLMRHAWELDEVDFDYYFFDENCSYQLLSLLEVARPELDLTGQFFYQAIPSDTVRVTVEAPDMLRDTAFRPALRTRINWRAEDMSASEQRLGAAIAATGLEPHTDALVALDMDARARVLDTAYDLMQYRYNREGGERSPHARASLALLRLRSTIPVGDTVPPRPDPDVPPHQGHATARADFALGRLDGASFVELRLRPAYHDLLDPPAGYTAGAEINMFALALRHHENDSLQLESLEFVDIMSLSPRSLLFKPMSWKINVAVRREWTAPGERPLTFALAAGGGLSYRLGDTALMYALGEAGLLAADELPGDVALGAGPSAGIIWRAAPAWNLQLRASALRFAGDLDHTLVNYALEQNFALNNRWGLRLSASRHGVSNAAVNEFNLSLNRYF